MLLYLHFWLVVCIVLGHLFVFWDANWSYSRTPLIERVNFPPIIIHHSMELLLYLIPTLRIHLANLAIITLTIISLIIIIVTQLLVSIAKHAHLTS